MIDAADELTVRFRSPEFAEAFRSSYDAALRRWPGDVTALDLPGPYGTTHVNTCGPAGAPPLVLLHGAGCTSAGWFANAGPLSQSHRLYAIDQIGDAGLSIPCSRPARRPEDLMSWLDDVLDQLGLNAAAFCGHSYGSWLALSYALHAPARVTRLALLDPTSCFGGYRRGYRLRAVPLFLRPSQARTRGFVTWETGGIPVDDLLLRLACLGGDEFRGARVVLPRRPPATALRAMRIPVLLVLAELSRAHDIQRIGSNAGRLVSDLTTVVLPGASHHSLPATSPGPLNERLADFLAAL